MALDRWAIHEHFIPGAYLRMYLFACLQILHTTSLSGLVVPFGVMNFNLLMVQYYDLFRRFDKHFVPGVDLENHLADDSHIARL